jgi:3-phenylpropionate/trans-cinnamate dioxygenase ferredoxin reductase component
MGEALGMTDERTFVIVGASLTGAKAAEQLRADGFAGRIVLVGAETDRPYERPPLSKGYLLGKEPRDKAFVHDATWYSEHDVDLVLGVEATAVDPKAHVVTLDNVQPLHYDKLLLATGSRVRTLDVPGSDNRGIHYWRRMTESETLRAGLREGVQVLIVGAGWIGLEVAAAAREHGATVTVVEMDSLPLRRVLGDEVAAFFRDVHAAHGVTFRFGTGVNEFGGSAGQVTHAVLTDGAEVPADLVVVGVGILPNVELAESAGLEVANGVVTDERLRTSDPDVYAAGDVASFLHPMIRERIRVEHWANALNSGPAAAKSMLGTDAPYDRVPYFYSDQYESAPAIGMEYSGYVAPGGYDRVVFRGSPAIQSDGSPEFVAFWTNRGRVLAGMNVNVWDVQDDIQALVRAGYADTSVDLDRLADRSVPLNDLLR